MTVGETANKQPSANEALNTRLHYWLQFFDIVDAQEADNNGPIAMEELDDLWAETGRMGQQCVVSGYGSWSEFIDLDPLNQDQEQVLMTLPRENRMLVARMGKVSMMPAVSQGFRFGQMTGYDRPTLHHQFMESQTPATNLDLTYTYAGSGYLQILAGTLELAPHFLRTGGREPAMQERYL